TLGNKNSKNGKIPCWAPTPAFKFRVFAPLKSLSNPQTKIFEIYFLKIGFLEPIASSCSRKRFPLLQLAGTGYLRELLGEEIFFTQPERFSGFIPADKTAVAIELDLVEPLLTFGKFLNRERMHGLDKSDLPFRKAWRDFASIREVVFLWFRLRHVMGRQSRRSPESLCRAVQLEVHRSSGRKRDLQPGGCLYTFVLHLP